jgi:uncharacterized protein (TIGR03067 family)
MPAPILPTRITESDLLGQNIFRFDLVGAYGYDHITLPGAEAVMRFVGIFATLVIAGASDLSGPAGKELRLLQGEWLLRRIEANGNKIERADDEAKIVMKIKGDKMLVEGEAKVAIVAIDPSTNPKCMDLKILDKGRDGRVDEAIYKIEGDTLTICVYLGQGRQRPLNFETPKQADTILVVLKRVK